MNTQNTYTYTARDADNPDKVITLTVIDDHIHVQLTGILDAVGNVFQAEGRSTEAGHQLAVQAAPAALKLAEGLSGPVQINDLSASLKGDSLTITAWRRAAGLRLAPMRISLDRVDNPEAAEAFIHELELRQDQAEHPGKFAGPLDYWLGWAGIALAIGALFVWPRKSSNGSSESQE
jgi:hypothetical protein